MTCFACEREPVQQCSRCGRPYCDEHGEELCDVCMQPSSGVPSFTLYRGSLLALLAGVAIAVWLLVQPTSGDNGAAALRPVLLTPTRAAVTATGAAGGANTTPGPVSTPLSPGATTTRPAGTGTPATTGTAAVTGTAASSDYTVVTGDTLSGICSRQRPNLGNDDCVSRLRTINGITGDSISIGQKLKLP